MTPAGRREFFRRIAVMGLLVCGLTVTSYDRYVVAAVLIGAAIVLYRYLPAIPPPAKALVYNKGMSQTGPDWIGFILSSMFIVVPIWASISEPNWGPIHPMSVVLWPMALITSSFWIIGALYASYWIVIEPQKLVISSAFSCRDIPFDAIDKVTRYRRGLPNWLYLLAPLMIASNQPGGAGALLLARDRTGMELVMKDGQRISIADSGYDEEIVKILQALDGHSIKLAATYKKRLSHHAEAKND